MLVWLLFTVISQGYTAFTQTRVSLDVAITQELADPQNTGDPEVIARGNYRKMFRDSFFALFPEATSRSERRALGGLISGNAPLQLREMVTADPSLIGQTVTVSFIADDMFDQINKGAFDVTLDANRLPFSPQQLEWWRTLESQDRVETVFNLDFFTSGPSREGELAGIGGAILGSFFTLTMTLALAFPIGVAAAIYLEEFAPKNKLTDVIEVNINNLAAVPSIIFGLLGLSMFLNFFGLPRHTPLVGGMVLALMTLPTIIIASRAALKAVPPSIRQAALGMGASRVQAVTHHVLPLALPGMLTGTIIGMAQALGETAPLLLIGMNAFIAEIPEDWFSAATVLPVQIYIWADTAERSFVEKTSAGIMVLLAFLVLMNLMAVLLRKRFERRW